MLFAMRPTALAVTRLAIRPVTGLGVSPSAAFAVRSMATAVKRAKKPAAEKPVAKKPVTKKPVAAKKSAVKPKKKVATKKAVAVKTKAKAKAVKATASRAEKVAAAKAKAKERAALAKEKQKAKDAAAKERLKARNASAKDRAAKRAKIEDRKLLTEQALFSEPKQLPGNAWMVFYMQRIKGSHDNNLAALAAEVKTAFEALSPSEVESLKTTAEANKAANKEAYRRWVHSHPGSQIYEANRARARLAKVYDVKRAGKSIKDDREPKRNMTANATFFKAKYDAGEYKLGTTHQSMADILKAIAAQWNTLTQAERKHYIDLSEADKARYTKEMKAYAGPAYKTAA